MPTRHEPPVNPPEPIIISDFSPGIFGDIHAGTLGTSRGSIAVDGAATIENTVGCGVDRTGALIPLPLVQSGPANVTLMPQVGGRAATSAYFPASMIANYNMDAAIQAPVIAYNTIAPNQPIVPITPNPEGYSLALLTRYFYANADGLTNGYDEFLVVQKFQEFPNSSYKTTPNDVVWDSSPGRGLTKWSSANFPTRILPGSLGYQRFDNGGSLNAYYLLPSLTVAYTIKVDHQTTAGGNLLPALERTYTNYGVANNHLGTPFEYVTYEPTTTAETALTSGYLGYYPYPEIGGSTSDNSAGFNATTIDAANFPTMAIEPYMIIGHQGRSVALIRKDQATEGGFTTTANYPGTDILVYSSPLGAFGYEGGSPGRIATGLTFAEDEGSLAGTMASMSADELLVIRHQGGAVLLRGDLSNPTIYRLPEVYSTQGVTSHAVVTPIGVVYGSRDGVYAWNGQGASTKISPQIDGFFWDHTTGSGGGESYQSTRGRFGYFDRYVAAPNNYLYDTEAKSWWKIPYGTGQDSTRPNNIYVTNPQTGDLHMVPYKITSTSSQPRWYIMDPDTLGSSWSWQSQPLVRSRKRFLQYQRVTLICSPGNDGGYFQFTVTLTGYDQQGALITSTSLLQSSGGATGPQTQMLIADMMPFLSAQYVTVKIVATSTTSAVAPKLHSIRFDVDERAGTKLDVLASPP